MNELVDFESRRNKYIRWEPARLVGDVVSGKAQVAAMWGPEAARYVKQSRQLLEMHLIPDRQSDRQGKPVPHHYSVALGVRKDDESLREALQTALVRKREEIGVILRREGMPLLPLRVRTAAR